MTTDAPKLRIEGQPPLDRDALARLGRAIKGVGGDTAFIMEAITEFIEDLRPVQVDATPPGFRDWLIESGAMSNDEFEATAAAVERGALQVMFMRSFLRFLSDTLTLEEATGVLGITEDEVRRAVEERTLHAFEVHGRLRFPLWQFDTKEPDHRLPGLTDIVQCIPQDMDWLSIQRLMTSPHEDLCSEGPQSPVEWLRDGGDIDQIRELVGGDSF